jgi:hypothetical protein
MRSETKYNHSTRAIKEGEVSYTPPTLRKSGKKGARKCDKMHSECMRDFGVCTNEPGRGNGLDLGLQM